MAAAVGMPVIMPMLCEHRRGLGLSLADLAPRASSDEQLDILGQHAFKYATLQEDAQGQQHEHDLLATSEGQRGGGSVAPGANIFDEVHTMVSQLLQQIRADTMTMAPEEDEAAEEEAQRQRQRNARDRFKHATSWSMPSVPLGSAAPKRSSVRRKSCPSCGVPGHLSADHHATTPPPWQQLQQQSSPTTPVTPWDRRRLRRAMTQPDLWMGTPVQASKPRARMLASPEASQRGRWMQTLRDSGQASSFWESQESCREAARLRGPRRPSEPSRHPDKARLSYSSDMGEHRESVPGASGCSKEQEESIRKLHREESLRRKQRAEAKKRREELKRRDEQARRQREELTKFLEEEALRMQREARREELEARRARREETKKKEQQARQAREAEEKARRKREAAERAEWRQRLKEEEAKSAAAAAAAAERRLLQEEAVASEHRRLQQEDACYRRQLREEDVRRRRRRRRRRGPDMDAAERRRKLVSRTAFHVAGGTAGQEQGVRLLSSSRRFDVHLPEVLTKVEEDEEEDDEDEEDEEAQLHRQRTADVLLTDPERHVVCSTGSQAWGLDQATLELEALVEQSHQALIRDGLLDPSVGGEAGGVGVSIPSLDAVDRALEELQRGLAEIDSALAKPSI